MSELPEDCIPNILSFTSPRDACRFSLVSSSFKTAADSDVVWEKFLPSDYKAIISRAVSPFKLDEFSSKKELYFRLCHAPIHFDGGNKSFNIDKETGKKCFFIGARELSIIWGDTPHLWEWLPHSHSRFAEVAEIKFVRWLEIVGKIETRMLSTNTTYAAYLVISFVEEDWFGLNGPTKVSVEVGGISSGVGIVQLEAPQRNGMQGPVQRGDGWEEIEMGEFYNDGGEDGEVEMSLRDVERGVSKGGLIVEGIELRPKRVGS